MSGGTLPSPGKTTGRAHSSFVLQNCFFVSPARAGAHLCGSGKTPGEEICWECLISLECFTSILAGCTTRCGIVTTCLLIEASKSRRLQNQTVQAGSPQSLMSASQPLPCSPTSFVTFGNICESQANPFSKFHSCLLPLLARCY